MNRAIAQKIAESAHEVIGYDVLVTDGEGTIIGANARVRIGDTHPPSLEVFRTGEPAETGRADAMRMQGVRPGYTAPIRIHKTVVGTVSIAGPPAKVRKYGLLVQKQAEILLQEQLLVETDLRREQARRDLAESILFRDARSASDIGDILLRARALGYEPTAWRTAVWIEPAKVGGDDRSALLRRIRSVLPPGTLVVLLRNRQFAALLPATPGESPGAICARAEATLRAANMPVRFGIGTPAEEVSALARSGQTARSALAAGRTLLGGDEDERDAVSDASALRLETMLVSLPRDRQREYVQDVLRDLTAEDGDGRLARTFRAWCRRPFAAARVAEALSIHRNTLQYRLKRIEALTGLNPWDFRDAATLWCAFALRELEK